MLSSMVSFVENSAQIAVRLKELVESDRTMGGAIVGYAIALLGGRLKSMS
jgi:hypothetical protein